MKILGLDISTANVGLCVIDTECGQMSRIVVADGAHISQIKGLYNKTCALRDRFLQLKEEHTIDLIVIEEPLQLFKAGRSSAGIIAKLNRFNGMVSWVAKSTFDCPLHMANVISTRKAVGCKIDRKSSFGTKDQVFAWVSSHPLSVDLVWPTKILKSGPNKGEKRFEAICYDMSDAFVVALFGATVLKMTDHDDSY